MNESTTSKRSTGCTRREFLERGSAAVVAMSAARVALPADTAPKKVRMGVVGGGFGCSFQWHEHPDCTVEAVSDLRPERRDALMKTYGCKKSYESLEKLVLDKDVDAVAIFTDGPLHVQHAVEAMRHGKH